MYYGADVVDIAQETEETKHQQGTAEPVNILGCCLVSLRFLCNIHSVLLQLTSGCSSPMVGLRADLTWRALGAILIWRPQWMGAGVPPKRRRKKQNQLICESDNGRRGSKNPKILRTSYMEAPWGNICSSQLWQDSSSLKSFWNVSHHPGKPFACWKAATLTTTAGIKASLTPNI